MKAYSDFMDEITPDEVYQGLLGHGMFAAKLPPIFSSETFYDYCITAKPSFSDDWQPFIHYESIRNTNVPRQLGVPNPMAYSMLCKCISDYWKEIQTHFRDKTKSEKHNVSRIHLRKMGGTQSLFEMNYQNWQTDGSPEPDLLIGSKYIVKADISTCFPSIYTHSLPWALVGKEKAKDHAGPKWKNEWYNKIDHYAQLCKNGETHGLLIGPHASNLLGEIILTTVDSKLSYKWKYIRNIDDYTCFATSREDAQMFLVELTDELRQFDLSLNHKKTEVIELPTALTKQWTRQISDPSLLYRKGKFDYIAARYYLDKAIEIMDGNKADSAILNYAIKALPIKDMTENAIEYCIKTIMHLSLIYPYLLQIVDEYVFKRMNVSVDRIKAFTQRVYHQELQRKNYDGVCYALFFALKYNFIIDNVLAQDSIDSDSCVFRLLAFLYFKKHAIASERAQLRNLAVSLKSNKDDLGRNWLFVYEALPPSEFSGDWKALKNKKVCFLRKEFQF